MEVENLNRSLSSILSDQSKNPAISDDRRFIDKKGNVDSKVQDVNGDHPNRGSVEVFDLASSSQVMANVNEFDPYYVERAASRNGVSSNAWTGNWFGISDNPSTSFQECDLPVSSKLPPLISVGSRNGCYGSNQQHSNGAYYSSEGLTLQNSISVGTMSHQEEVLKKYSAKRSDPRMDSILPSCGTFLSPTEHASNQNGCISLLNSDTSCNFGSYTFGNNNSDAVLLKSSSSYLSKSLSCPNSGLIPVTAAETVSNCNGFCTFRDSKPCHQRRLNGYQFCIRHILNDKDAPYRSCSFVRVQNGKQIPCRNSILKNKNTHFIKIQTFVYANITEMIIVLRRFFAIVCRIHDTHFQNEYCSTHLIKLGFKEPKSRKKTEKMMNKVEDSPSGSLVSGGQMKTKVPFFPDLAVPRVQAQAQSQLALNEPPKLIKAEQQRQYDRNGFTLSDQPGQQYSRVKSENTTWDGGSGGYRNVGKVENSLSAMLNSVPPGQNSRSSFQHAPINAYPLGDFQAQPNGVSPVVQKDAKDHCKSAVVPLNCAPKPPAQRYSGLTSLLQAPLVESPPPVFSTSNLGYANLRSFPTNAGALVPLRPPSTLGGGCASASPFPVDPPVLECSNPNAPLPTLAPAPLYGRKCIKVHAKQRFFLSQGRHRQIPEVGRLCHLLEKVDAERKDLFPLGIRLEMSDSESELDELDDISTCSNGALLAASASLSFRNEYSVDTTEIYLANKAVNIRMLEWNNKLPLVDSMVKVSRQFPSTAGRVLGEKQDEKSKKLHSSSSALTKRRLLLVGCQYKLSAPADGLDVSLGICNKPRLPYSAYCVRHQLSNGEQMLYARCSGKDCDQPAIEGLVSGPSPVCHLHSYLKLLVPVSTSLLPLSGVAEPTSSSNNGNANSSGMLPTTTRGRPTTVGSKKKKAPTNTTRKERKKKAKLGSDNLAPVSETTNSLENSTKSVDFYDCVKCSSPQDAQLTLVSAVQELGLEAHELNEMLGFLPGDPLAALLDSEMCTYRLRLLIIIIIVWNCMVIQIHCCDVTRSTGFVEESSKESQLLDQALMLTSDHSWADVEQFLLSEGYKSSDYTTTPTNFSNYPSVEPLPSACTSGEDDFRTCRYLSTATGPQRVDASVFYAPTVPQTYNMDSGIGYGTPPPANMVSYHHHQQQTHHQHQHQPPPLLPAHHQHHSVGGIGGHHQIGLDNNINTQTMNPKSKPSQLGIYNL
ncbi:INO80 complex subunit D [Trichinella spiralis]|uniref:INO80 complex subunit D n=1 Tax=Trichinella spiralis TaxID=6334 RepID=A0A0V1C0L5_TRISP|nr:INO80 complex subunit D [Trichinella spiralis]